MKSTGPRTVAGKARASLNALKHGRFAHGLVDKLTASRQSGEAAVYNSIWRQFETTFGIEDGNDLKQAEQFSNSAYALARQARLFRTKPECALFSARLGPRSQPLFRFCVTDRVRRLGLAFWVQRKGFWNMDRLTEAMFRPNSKGAEPPLGQSLESRLRHRAYRMYRPGAWERVAYGLDLLGRPHPTLKPQPAMQRLLNRFDGRWGVLR